MLGVLLLLTPVVYFIPQDGIDLGWTKVNFLSQEDYFNPKEQENTDITDIISDVDTTMVAVDIDSLIQHQNNTTGTNGAPKGGEVSEDSSTELQFAENGKDNLFRFFRILQGVSSKKRKSPFCIMVTRKLKEIG